MDNLNEKDSNEEQSQPSLLGAVSGSLTHGEALRKIRQRYLDSTHPLRWIQYSIEERSYMNERKHIFV